jgi:hypothetical protein
LNQQRWYDEPEKSEADRAEDEKMNVFACEHPDTCTAPVDGKETLYLAPGHCNAVPASTPGAQRNHVRKYKFGRVCPPGKEKAA